MEYSILGAEYANTIKECNSYLEGHFKNVLKSEYDESDISEKIGTEYMSTDMVNFHRYSLYCWRMFYYLFEGYPTNLNDTIKYKLHEMAGENIFINKQLAENELPRFTFFIARFLIIHRSLGGVIAYSTNANCAGYVENFYKVKDCAPYIGKVLKENGSKVDFHALSYVDVWSIKDLIREVKFKEAVENLNKINTNEVNLSELIGKQETLKNEVNEIEKRLDGYKGEYNFVLLSKAFKRMKDDKINELKTSRWWMNLYTLVLVSIPVLTLIALFKEWVTFDSSIKHLMYAVPVLTLEILIFYFMRLYYSEVRSIRAQLLQIDLRLSLCEFIHDFIEKKNESKDHSDSWGNFESLIFSPIQMSADNIPSVLDGANAVADVLGKVMPKK
ncbi:hypothetical protein D3C81_561050 [compost metagenome]